MKLFDYKGYDRNGTKLTGKKEATTLLEAKQLLLSEGVMLSSIKEVKESSASQLKLFQSNKVTLKDLEFLTSELAILLSNGIRIDKALAILTRSKSDGSLGAVIQKIHGALKKGKTVAEAFTQSSDEFDALYINLIEIGEATGELDKVFRGLADDLKFRRELRAKIIQSITYPSVIMFVCVASVLFVFNFIVPQMATIFTDSDDIPIYTQILISTSEWLQNYQLFLYVGICIALAASISAFKRPQLRLAMEEKMLNLPVVKNVIIQTERIKFNSAMSMMLKAGLKVDNAIGFAASSVNNRVIQSSLNIAKDKIKKGSPISSCLAATLLFPQFFISLLEVGEETGNLDRSFEEIAARSRTEFEDWTTRVTSLLEPILILVLGGIVGSVVVTMLLSVVSVNDVGI